MLKYNCVTCNDAISDPICRGCYLKQTRILLNDLNLHEVANTIILTKIESRFPQDSLNDTPCILCNETKVTLFHYCYTVILVSVLRELNFSEDLIEKFKSKIT